MPQQRLVARVVAQRIEGLVVLHPVKMQAAGGVRDGEELLQLGQRLVRSSEGDPGAGEVVGGDEIVRVDPGRARRPVQGALRLAEIGQDGGAEGEGLGVVGVDR
jgi:hypothetical protein